MSRTLGLHGYRAPIIKGMCWSIPKKHYDPITETTPDAVLQHLITW
jgi:hypothetical protein